MSQLSLFAKKSFLGFNKGAAILLIALPIFFHIQVVHAQAENNVVIKSANNDVLETVIVTATRTAESADNVPLNISQIGSQELQEINAVHIQQVLARVPGVTTQRGNGQESLPGIRSAVQTGAGACGSVLVLEDAIPVRGPAFCNVNELFDTHFENAESIEVTRGPGTAFFGSNALTGMVNVNLATQGPNYISMEAGSNEYMRLQSAYNLSTQSRNRIALSLTHDGGYRDDAGFEQYKLSWRHAQGDIDNGFNAGLTITSLDQQTAGFIVGENAYQDKRLARQNLDPEAFRYTRSIRAWGRWHRQLNDTQQLQLTSYVRSSDMDFRMHFLPGDPLEQNAQTGVGWQSALTTEHSNNFTSVVGIDGDWSDGELRQSQENPTSGSPFLVATIPAGIQYDYAVVAKQLAAFSHVRWTPNDRWQVIAGIRGERLDYEYDNLTLDGRTRDDGTDCVFGGCRYSRPADRDDTFTDWSTKLQVRYQVNDQWQTYVAASESARAPQATELYRLQREQQVADLDSVTADNLEISVVYESDTLSLNASIYRLDLNNVIIRDSDFFSVDGNATESEGLEFAADWSINTEWSLQLNGTYAEHKYASDQIIDGSSVRGLFVDTAPKTAGSLRLRFAPNDRYSVTAELQHEASYFLEPTNAFEYAGHEIVNLYARKQLNAQWTLSARLLNVLDARYAKRADYTSFTQQRYFPGESRTFFISARREF